MKPFFRYFYFHLLILLPITGATQVQIAVPEEISTLAQEFQVPMLQCPERIWSDYDWNNSKVLFVRSKKQSSFLWDAPENNYVELQNTELEPSYLLGLYSFFEDEGKSVVSLNIDLMPDFHDQLFRVGVHELFHFSGQKNWKKKNGTKSRGTNYPLVSRPRLLRRMLFDNLQNYFLTNNPQSLQKASHWYKTWSREFPSEVLATTDGYEGSALYVDSLASVILENGCGATELELEEATKVHAQNYMGGSVSGRRFALDAEGYDIGGMASMILRFDPSQNLKDWNERVAQGENPVEIVLEKQVSVAEEIPKALSESFEEMAQETNQAWGALINEPINNWNSKDFLRVSTSYEMMAGSFSPHFFAFSTAIQRALFPFAVQQEFISKVENSSIFTMLENSVLIETSESPCPSSNFVTLVAKKDWLGSLEVSSGIQSVEIDTKTIKGRLVGNILNDEKGHTYLCLQ